ncbi:hypothetical protein WN51_02392 [Melipona quadrifasciata]|uniref:Uncharacterized protein n=1 Tax=Melipona quadrifasciata TaxID=166423 RepID=A0A0M8ZXD2_9HYME|nr:hypothetical protein WN51_02392 [Melipona quadrifasciata]
MEISARGQTSCRRFQYDSNNVWQRFGHFQPTNDTYGRMKSPLQLQIESGLVLGNVLAARWINIFTGWTQSIRQSATDDRSNGGLMRPTYLGSRRHIKIPCCGSSLFPSPITLISVVKSSFQALQALIIFLAFHDIRIIKTFVALYIYIINHNKNSFGISERVNETRVWQLPSHILTPATFNFMETMGLPATKNTERRPGMRETSRRDSAKKRIINVKIETIQTGLGNRKSKTGRSDPIAPSSRRLKCSGGKKRPLTFLLVILVGVIGAVMKMMGGRMVASYRRHQGVVPQCRMRMMRMMMTEEPDSGGGCLVLSLHRLLYLALNLSEDRMMRWPSCQVKRKHRCRPLEQSGRSQKGTTGTSGAATRRQWEGQTTSWFQDHDHYGTSQRHSTICLESEVNGSPLSTEAKLVWVATQRLWIGRIDGGFTGATLFLANEDGWITERTPPRGRLYRATSYSERNPDAGQRFRCDDNSPNWHKCEEKEKKKKDRANNKNFGLKSFNEPCE